MLMTCRAHLVTSALFLPSLVTGLSPTSISLLLRSYLTFSIAWYIGRGRPSLPLKDFFATVPADPTGPTPRATPAKGALMHNSAFSIPNPWFPIIQSSLVHPDDHLCKMQRALAHFATVYGDRPAGEFAELAQDGLEGAEVLDGTLFVRVAGLVADRLGWMWEGGDRKRWDHLSPAE